VTATVLGPDGSGGGVYTSLPDAVAASEAQRSTWTGSPGPFVVHLSPDPLLAPELALVEDLTGPTTMRFLDRQLLSANDGNSRVDPHPIDVVDGSCANSYGYRFDLWRGPLGELKRLQDHFWGPSLSRTLSTATPDDPGNTNRIYAFHQARLRREHLDTQHRLLDENLDKLPSLGMSFANPNRYTNGPGSLAFPVISAAQARHDFLAELHASDGVWMFKWQPEAERADEETTVLLENMALLSDPTPLSQFMGRLSQACLP
jgi:hypothetical protein